MMLNPNAPFGFKWMPSLETLAWIGRFLKAATTRQVAESAPVLRDLNLAGKQGYRELAARLGVDFGLAEKGLLMLCKTDRALEEEVKLAEEAGKLGLKTAILGLHELPQIEPAVGSKVCGAVHFLDDAHLTPSALMDGLRDYLRQVGVKFVTAEAKTFQTDQRRVVSVQTDKESYQADEFILAAGAWTGSLISGLGIRLPIVSGKGYGFTVSSFTGQPRLPAILVEARIAATPALNGTRYVGVMELGEPNFDFRKGRIVQMQRQAPLYYNFELPPSPNLLSWIGNRPCTPDGVPYIGRLSQFDNLNIATGHAMMGMSTGPATGELMAQILHQEKPFMNVEPFNPNRYQTSAR